jgi:SagB-type dehydrogenase family enzyme
MKQKFVFTLSFFYLLFIQDLFTQEIKLPSANKKSNVSFEETIYKWSATRRFQNKSLTLNQISQLLWSAFGTTVDGVTSATRVFPSAGAIYPLELYIVVGNVENLPAGLYKYNYKNHSLTQLKKGDLRDSLTSAALNQFFIKQAPVNFVWTAKYNKVAIYGERGKTRYIHIDLGHSAQNLTIQATALGLGTVQVGAFDDEKVKEILSLPDEETPVYIMPVGYKK